MGVTFRCDGGAMQKVREKLQLVQQALEETSTAAKGVEDRIGSKRNWESQSQETMAAYMDLLVQYHADLATGKRPLEDAEEALKKLMTNLETFYENWPEWKGLDDIV